MIEAFIAVSTGESRLHISCAKCGELKTFSQPLPVQYRFLGVSYSKKLELPGEYLCEHCTNGKEKQNNGNCAACAE